LRLARIATGLVAALVFPAPAVGAASHTISVRLIGGGGPFSQPGGSGQDMMKGTITVHVG